MLCAAVLPSSSCISSSALPAAAASLSACPLMLHSLPPASRMAGCEREDGQGRVLRERHVLCRTSCLSPLSHTLLSQHLHALHWPLMQPFSHILCSLALLLSLLPFAARCPSSHLPPLLQGCPAVQGMCVCVCLSERAVGSRCAQKGPGAGLAVFSPLVHWRGRERSSSLLLALL